jgi:hypothetical protein
MLSLLPSLPPQSGKDYFAALLDLMLDPAAVKARYDELRKHVEVANDAAMQAQEASAALDTKSKSHDADIAKAMADIASAHQMLDAKAKDHAKAVAASEADIAIKAGQLAKHHAALSAKQVRIEAWDKTVAGREMSVANREEALKKNEETVAARQKDVDMLLAEAKGLKASYETKHAALTSILSSPNKFEMQAETGRLGATGSDIG